MPVIRPTRRWDSPTPRQTLVDRLAEELAGRGTQPGPVIFEIPIIVNNTIHVIVVWIEWEGIPSNERSSIILESYAVFDASRPQDEPVTPRITVAVGSTPEEIRASDLLPYTVQPAVDPKHPSYPQIRQAMIEEGAIEFPTGVELRFPTIQMAREAERRLTRKPFEGVSVPFWQLGETVCRIHD